jgi:hypothetical protein
MMLSNTDHVKDLSSRGNVGVRTQPVPHLMAVPKQTSSSKETPE